MVRGSFLVTVAISGTVAKIQVRNSSSVGPVMPRA
jgi:hypothetical protein